MVALQPSDNTNTNTAMNTETIFGGIFSHDPGTPERAKAFRDFLKQATDLDLAFLNAYGLKTGTVYVSGSILQDKEEEAIRRKVKDRTAFKGWLHIASALIDVHAKIFTLHENIYKVSNYMNAMGALWVSYENTASVFSGFMYCLEKIQGEGAEQAKALARQFAGLELNDIVDTFDDDKLVTYSLEDNHVAVDYRPIKGIMEQGESLLRSSLSRMKGFEAFLDDLKRTAAERGEDLRPEYLSDTERYINNCKGSLSVTQEFSAKRYKQLIQEGNTEEAEKMKQRFVFPDYEDVPVNETVRDFHIKTVNVWKRIGAY